MINKILIGLMFVAGIANNVHDVPGAFWTCYMLGLTLVFINRSRLIELLK